MKRLLPILFALPLTIHAETITGRVVAVADGDTLTVLDGSNTQHKVRLAGIDAPEKKQPFGDKSKQALSDCALGKAAAIDSNKRDRYKRLVSKVVVAGTDCNLRQVQLGMAWHYKKYEREQEVEDRSLYAQAEYLAQRDKLGLWSDVSPVAPWDFRKKR